MDGGVGRGGEVQRLGTDTQLRAGSVTSRPARLKRRLAYPDRQPGLPLGPPDLSTGDS